MGEYWFQLGVGVVTAVIVGFVAIKVLFKTKAPLGFKVAKASDIPEGSMREVTVNEEASILLVKTKGEISALGNRCTHLGAPLKNGVIVDGKIRCQWHGACFSGKTGDIEDFPCSDALNCFPVEVQNGDVYVQGTIEQFRNHKRNPKVVKANPVNKELFLIIGAGPAGNACAETLRQKGWTGRVVVASREKHLPYDRTKLSKSMTATAEQARLRTAEFYKENNIELLLGVEVTALDTTKKTATLSNGTTLEYKGVLIAVGGHPRLLPVPGKELNHIYPVRIPEESNAIVANADASKNLVIVGSSFIGMEVAAALVKKVKSCTVIGMERVPFERVLGAEVGDAMQKLFESNGVQFRLNQKPIREFQGVDGNVSAVVLDDGEVLPADVVVIGAGIIPSTDFVNDIEKFRDGSIIVDKYMRVKGRDNTFVAGDIARFPYFLVEEVEIRVEHYGAAMYQGALAARNFLGENASHSAVPFFWTNLFGKGLRYAGHAFAYDEVIVQGDLDNLKFAAYYSRNNEILAVLAVGMDPATAAAAELLAHKALPSAALIKQQAAVDLPALAAALNSKLQQ